MVIEIFNGINAECPDNVRLALDLAVFGFLMARPTYIVLYLTISAYHIGVYLVSEAPDPNIWTNPKPDTLRTERRIEIPNLRDEINVIPCIDYEWCTHTTKFR